MVRIGVWFGGLIVLKANSAEATGRSATLSSITRTNSARNYQDMRFGISYTHMD